MLYIKIYITLYLPQIIIVHVPSLALSASHNLATSSRRVEMEICFYINSHSMT